MYSDIPRIGVGIGWRREIAEEILLHKEHIDWCEIIAEHYINVTPDKLDQLSTLARTFPIAPHGIDLSIGTDQPIEPEYLDSLSALVKRVDAPWFTDHLCFTRVEGYNMGQLTPLQFSAETVEIVVRKIKRIKETIPKPFLLENITYYFQFPGNEMSEPAFIRRVLEEADIGMLLDLCNVYINSINHGYDPYQFLESIPLDRVVQLHIAGGHKHHTKWVDSHSASVHAEVFRLLEFVVSRAPVKGILLERDGNFPPVFQELVADLAKAREIFTRYHGRG
jgi:uncharacterized protein (UPF0276 family)